MSKPSLVLVHGSWHCPEHYGPLINVLSAHVYKCVTVALPSIGSADEAPRTLSDDTAAVRKAVTSELDAGNNVVVVAHSYGGNPTNNALEGLDEKSRSAAGKTTCVTAISFICALPLPAGFSFAKLLSTGTPIHEARGDFTYVKDPPGPAHYFYNDLSPEEAKRWSDMLRPQSAAVYAEDTTFASYNYIDSWYLFCAKDNAIPVEAQKGLVAAAVEAGARFQTEEFDCSHSPFLSLPGKTADFIRKSAGEKVV